MIFGTTKAADSAMSRLNEDCLMLSGQRLLTTLLYSTSHVYVNFIKSFFLLLSNMMIHLQSSNG